MSWSPRALVAAMRAWMRGRRERRPTADPEVRATLARAAEARRQGRRDEAERLYRAVLRSDRGELEALRGLRDLALEGDDWASALELQHEVLAVAGAERGAEARWLAVAHYTRGRAELAHARATDAIAHFRQAQRSDRTFLPAVLALGDAHEAAGDLREAVRTWERAAETQPALALLARLERAYRREGRPSRMIALYRAATEQAPDDLSLAAALGRVYLELEMLDEAADQLEKLEVRAPDLPTVHAFLGGVFERQGDTRQAFEEYRRALRLAHAFEWPHRCGACGAVSTTWVDRCPSCGRWGEVTPVSGP
jgi:lipopolysaccharide assembly protein B